MASERRTRKNAQTKETQRQPIGSRADMNDTKVVKAGGKKPPAAGKGRKAGSLNKTTRAAKEAIAFAAEALGGAERLTAWAREDQANERAFWTTIYPKLLPLQVSGDSENPLGIIINVKFD
jgi:hypothetical protein